MQALLPLLPLSNARLLSYIGGIENLRIGAARGHANGNIASIIDEVIIFFRGCEPNRCSGSHFEILNRVKRYLIKKNRLTISP